jgi:site-specific DNA recombinase
MGGETIFRCYNLNRRAILVILFICTTTCLVHLLHNGSGIFSPFLLAGLLDRDEVDGDQWAIISRVSSPDQEGDGSLDVQNEELRDEIEKADGEVVKSFYGSESAASADRKTLNDITTLAEEGKIDIFGAYKFDRITRAHPMESTKFFVDLYNAGVTIYIGKEGYLDLNSLSDYQLTTRRIADARRRYEEIMESAKESYIRGLEQGQYRYGPPHFGYTRDAENHLSLTPLGKKVIPRIFEVYIDVENRSKTVDIINDEFDLSGEDELTSDRVKTVLESRKCIGELCHKDYLVNTKTELAVVSRKQFRQAQKIAKKRRNTPTQEEIWPEWVSEFAKRYNLEIPISTIGNLQPRCRKCDGELICYGSGERGGSSVPKIKCKDCPYQGPLITQSEFDKLHSMAPMRCPECIAVDGFQYEEVEGGKWDYVVTCSLCGCSFATNSSPEKYERALDQSGLEFIPEDPDVKELLTAILESKEQAVTRESSAQSEPVASAESDSSSEHRSLSNFT